MNTNGTRARKLIKKSFSIDAATVAAALADGPEQLVAAQTRLDTIRLEHEAYTTALSIRALYEPLFPGKGPEDPKRIAANDKERELAISSILTNDADYILLRDKVEAAQRDVALARDRQLNARLIAQLLLAQERIA